MYVGERPEKRKAFCENCREVSVDVEQLRPGDA
jgi:hypothetical protein